MGGRWGGGERAGYRTNKTPSPAKMLIECNSGRNK